MCMSRLGEVKEESQQLREFHHKTLDLEGTERGNTYASIYGKSTQVAHRALSS